jgi:hypothetical protein
MHVELWTVVSRANSRVGSSQGKVLRKHLNEGNAHSEPINVPCLSEAANKRTTWLTDFRGAPGARHKGHWSMASMTGRSAPTGWTAVAASTPPTWLNCICICSVTARGRGTGYALNTLGHAYFDLIHVEAAA